MNVWICIEKDDCQQKIKRKKKGSVLGWQSGKHGFTGDSVWIWWQWLCKFRFMTGENKWVIMKVAVVYNGVDVAWFRLSHSFFRSKRKTCVQNISIFAMSPLWSSFLLWAFRFYLFPTCTLMVRLWWEVFNCWASILVEVRLHFISSTSFRYLKNLE